jgi:hypothetical protein
MKTAKYLPVEHKTTQDALKEVKAHPVLGKISNYKNKGVHDIHRTDRSRLQQDFMKYQPAGNRKPGHQLKRLLDFCIGTGTDREA